MVRYGLGQYGLVFITNRGQKCPQKGDTLVPCPKCVVHCLKGGAPVNADCC